MLGIIVQDSAKTVHMEADGVEVTRYLKRELRDWLSLGDALPPEPDYRQILREITNLQRAGYISAQEQDVLVRATIARHLGGTICDKLLLALGDILSPLSGMPHAR